MEGRGHDFVGDGFIVDGVVDGIVLDFEGAVCVDIKVVAAGVGDEGVLYGVAGTVGVPVSGTRHGVSFGVDEAIGVAIEHGVDAEREYVLVMRCENSVSIVLVEVFNNIRRGNITLDERPCQRERRRLRR